MNMILSIILSIAMLFSGTGTLPAVPETAAAYTMSDVTIEVNGESITLNPSLKLTAAAGADQLALTLDVMNNGETLIPLAGKMDAEGVTFSLSDNGKAFSMSNAALEELIGFEMDEESEEVLNLVVEFMQLIPRMNDVEAANKLSAAMIEEWVARSGAAVAATTVEVDGKFVPAQHISMELSAEDVLRSLDVLAQSENEAFRSYHTLFLKLMGMASGGEYESFSALTDALVEDIGPSEMLMPLEITIADDGSYALTSMMMEQDGVNMTMSVAVIAKEDSVVEDILLIASQDDGEGNVMDMNIMANVYADAAGNMNYSMSMASANEYSYESTDSEGASYKWGGGDIIAMTADANVAVDENGLASTFANMDVEVTEASFDESYDEDYTHTTLVSASTASSERAEEDGSVTTNCVANFSASEDGVDPMIFGVSFNLNRAEVPYADPFEGAEIVNLPADTEDEAYAGLEAELMAPLGGLMMLSSDESVIKLSELFAAQEDYEVGYDSDYDDEYTGSDSSEVTTLEEAAAVYGGEIPAYTAPEGYELSYIYADEEYLSLDYSSEDSYFSISMMPDYFGDLEKVMYLQQDGSLLESEGTPVRLSFYEDGTISYASLILDGTSMDFYFDSADIATVQEVLSGLQG